MIAFPAALFTLPLAGRGGAVGDPKRAIVGTCEAEGPSGVIWSCHPDGTATETLTKVG